MADQGRDRDRKRRREAREAALLRIGFILLSILIWYGLIAGGVLLLDRLDEP